MKKKIFLIGGYNKTKSLAQSLIRKGYNVTAINKNIDHCRSLAEIEKLTVFHGDGTKPFILEDADAYNADIAIALTGRDDDNLVICELCKKKFKIQKTVSLLLDQNKTEFFHRMGIDSVVCANSDITGIIEHQAFLDEVATLIPVGGGRIKLTEVPIAHYSPAVNRTLAEIRLPKDVIIGCILRGSKTLIPSGDTRLLDGDVLMLISTEEREIHAVRELTGR